MKMNDKYDLLKLDSFETALYERYSLTTLVAYCIFWLHEWNITTSLENITVASYKMFPGKFSMVGWAEFPDANRINRSILQMRPKYRNIASSASDKGVFLNQSGIAEAKALIDKIGPPFFEGETRSPFQKPAIKAVRGTGKARSIHPEDLIKKLKNSQLYNLFAQSCFDEAEAIHLIGLLGVYDHTPSQEKKRKLREFIEAAKDLKEKNIEDFLNIVTERFQKYLNK